MQEELQSFTTAEVTYYAAIFVVAFLASVSQTLRANAFINGRHCINIGMVAGFLAFAIVSFIDGTVSDRVGSEFFYLGVAALIGLSSRWHDVMLGVMWGTVGKKYGFEIPEEMKKGEKVQTDVNETKTNSPEDSTTDSVGDT